MLLSHLHYLTKLAETEHYGKAAKELHITQPTLSYAIKSLEQELDVKLFEREGRGVRLTEEGRFFVAAIKKSLYEIDKAIDQVQEKSDSSLSGTINIGAVYSVQGDYLPRLLKDFSEDVPNKIDFNIKQGFSKNLVQGVQSGEYDIVFCAMVRNTPDVVYSHVISHELVVAVSNDNDMSQLDVVSLNDLKGKDVYTYKLGTPIGDEVADLLSTFDIHANYEWEDEISLGGLVSTDKDKVVVATLSIGLKLFPNITLIPILGIPKNFHRIYVSYKKSNNYQGKSLETFIEYIENYMPPKSARPSIKN